MPVRVGHFYVWYYILRKSLRIRNSTYFALKYIMQNIGIFPPILFRIPSKKILKTSIFRTVTEWPNKIYLWGSELATYPIEYRYRMFPWCNWNYRSYNLEQTAYNKQRCCGDQQQTHRCDNYSGTWENPIDNLPNQPPPTPMQYKRLLVNYNSFRNVHFVSLVL